MESVEKYQKMETQISDVIVQVQRIFFSNYAVAKIMAGNKDLIDQYYTLVNKQIKRGSIPAEYFETYIKAWRQIDKKPLERHIEAGGNKELLLASLETIDDAKWNEMGDTAIESVDKIVSFWKRLNDFDAIPVLDNNHALDGKSARFPHLISECFDAFTTLTLDDMTFLYLIFGGNQCRRKAVLQEMTTSKVSVPNQIISMLTCKEGKSWLRACELYSSKIDVKESVQDCWDRCVAKIQKWRKKNAFLPAWKTGRGQEANKVFSFNLFLSLIWPQDDADDTEFGAEEIKALITFKYFLTEDARQGLIDKFQKGQPKE